MTDATMLDRMEPRPDRGQQAGAVAPPRPGPERVTVIQPTKGWRSFDVGELWAYRELLIVLTMRDITVRYKQTVLGALWAIIQPVLTMLVFSIFFGMLARMPSDGLPYPLFVFAALLPWTFFSTAVSASSSSLISSANLISKVYFPRILVPIASIGAALVDFAIASLVLLAMMAWYGVMPGVSILAVPVLTLLVVITALGVGALSSALCVAYRDFRFIIPFSVQLWLFVTPVVYPASLVPADWRWLLYLNPMAGIVEGFRAAYFDRPFDWLGIGISVAAACVMLVLSIAIFERLERRLADII